VATYLRIAGSSEKNCEPSVVHITWLDICDGFHELMYRLKQLTVVSFRYCTDRFYYVIAVCEEIRQTLYV
jgi:hypothetical protein